jgi:AraC-like DNA-binding protein
MHWDVKIESGPLKVIYLALSWHAGPNSEICSPTMDQIVQFTGLSRSTVKRLTADLERFGYVEIWRQTGRGNANHYRLKEVQKRVHAPSGKIQRNQRKGVSVNQVSPIESLVDGNEPLSDEVKARRNMDRRTRVTVRRQQVQDGYLSFIALLDAGQFATVPAVAKHLGMSPSTVRSDLDAIFRTMDISYEDQRRLRKSQRKPAHWGKLRVVNGGRF